LLACVKFRPIFLFHVFSSFIELLAALRGLEPNAFYRGLSEKFPLCLPLSVGVERPGQEHQRFVSYTIDGLSQAVIRRPVLQAGSPTISFHLFQVIHATSPFLDFCFFALLLCVGRSSLLRC